MDLNEIKKLADLMSEMALTEIELEEDGKRIRLRKEIVFASKERGLAPVASSQVLQEAVTAIETKGEEGRYALVRSPIVGTFYKAASPDADPYVEIGDVVKKGQILCIVEAMKLMNEIESDVDGKIAEICVEDGTAVEYGKPLFRIEPV
ncbi:MAG: acetyl-CoA carboxylase biotin carboxyl carrier protein [Candidatus Manganitrophaceae bacterium]|nr:MAG: acetyl-CoA carboxylase biotin carboxyl carrier protein [Candidatus Manganitrophaceae bacterium]